MSSHREAPEISKDPVADNTDLYAFVSPDEPDTVTLIANYIPLEDPAGRAELLRVRRRRALRDPRRQRRRRRAPTSSTSSGSRPRSATPDTFLYNTGPIASLDGPNWNRRQSYTVTPDRAAASRRPRGSGTDLAVPAVQRRAPLDARTTPRSPTRRSTTSADGMKVFAGQRADGFYVDLGSIFDLGDLRPFQNLHLIPTAGRGRRQRPDGRQRALDRAPGADRPLTRDGTTPDRPDDARRR